MIVAIYVVDELHHKRVTEVSAASSWVVNIITLSSQPYIHACMQGTTVFIGRCLATKVFIGKLLAVGWV